MPFVERLAPPIEIPPEWQDTSVFRYVDDPFSIEALAEPHKTCIDLGALNIEACFDALEGAYIKNYGEEAVIPENLPEELVRAHRLVIGASRRLLGEGLFVESEIAFTYRRSLVEPGTCQMRVGPHVDGNERFVGERVLRFIGLGCNVLPTILLNGAMTPNSLDETGRLKHIRGLNRRFKSEDLPVSRLTLVPPALLHDTPRLPTDTSAPVDRLFMRWHIRA